MPIDPNEPLYCFCRQVGHAQRLWVFPTGAVHSFTSCAVRLFTQVAFGQMIACDNPDVWAACAVRLRRMAYTCRYAVVVVVVICGDCIATVRVRVVPLSMRGSHTLHATQGGRKVVLPRLHPQANHRCALTAATHTHKTSSARPIPIPIPIPTALIATRPALDTAFAQLRTGPLPEATAATLRALVSVAAAVGEQDIEWLVAGSTPALEVVSILLAAVGCADKQVAVSVLDFWTQLQVGWPHYHHTHHPPPTTCAHPLFRAPVLSCMAPCRVLMSLSHRYCGPPTALNYALHTRMYR